MPRTLLGHPNLSLTEKVLLAYINAFPDGCWETNERIGLNTGMSKATVKRTMVSLEKKGILRIFKKHNKKFYITINSEKFNKILRFERLDKT